MTYRSIFCLILVALFFLFVAVPLAQSAEKKLDSYNTIVIKPFTAAVKGAIGLPAATQDAVSQALKESLLFKEVVTPDDAKPESTPAKEVKPATDTAQTTTDAVLKPVEAKMVEARRIEPAPQTRTLYLEAKLVDFEPGNAGKRLMVGFGTGRAHAGFEFTLRDAATGEVVWTKTIKQTASFWFNGTTSSAAERAELPEGLAKKLISEMKKERVK